jgi:hypothetical protein
MGNDGTEPCDLVINGIERIKLAHHTPGVSVTLSVAVAAAIACHGPTCGLRYIGGQPWLLPCVKLCSSSVASRTDAVSIQKDGKDQEPVRV